MLHSHVSPLLVSKDAKGLKLSKDNKRIGKLQRLVRLSLATQQEREELQLLLDCRQLVIARKRN
jgi:hypothetical protein